MSYKLVKWI